MTMKTNNRDLKQILINALIELANKKDFNSITVKDICLNCEVSRQAFYYHFSGIYELLGYFYKTESDKILKESQNQESLKVAFVNLMYWGLKNRNILISTYNSAQRDSVENFMYRIINPYIINIIAERSKALNITDEQSAFIAKYYTLSINAIYLDWLKHGMQEEPEVLVNNASLLLTGGFERTLLNFNKNNH